MKKILYVGIIAMLLLMGVVLADQINPPNAFYGSVMTNDVPAADGLLVIAKIGGSEYATTTLDGKYGYSPQVFHVLDGETTSREGMTISFYVKDKKNDLHLGGTSLFRSGHWTALDLAVTGDFSSTSGGNTGGTTGGTTGGIGGGTGGVAPLTADDADAQDNADDSLRVTVSDESVCEPDWFCSAWEDCLANKQKRTCVDNNGCAITEGIPPTVRECTVLDFDESAGFTEPTGFFNRLTGAVIGGGVGSWIFFVVLLAIIGSALGLVAYKRKKN